MSSKEKENLENLKSRYRSEWDSITYDILQVRQGYVKEKYGHSYPSLNTQANRIEEKFNDLLNKVANDLPSDTDELFE